MYIYVLHQSQQLIRCPLGGIERNNGDAMGGYIKNLTGIQLDIPNLCLFFLKMTIDQINRMINQWNLGSLVLKQSHAILGS